MDEPLSNLDAQLRQEMRREIRALQRKLGITMVYVTHDQTEALAMSDRVAVFHHGRIQQIDTPTQLYESPSNAFVAQFIGENNTLHGRVSAISDGSCEVTLGNGLRLPAQAVAVQQVGQATRLSIRPERIHLNPPAGVVQTTVTGTVIDVTYLGRYARLRMNACGLEDFIVTLPNDGRDLSLQAGSSATLGWNVADCRALDGE
jgi:putative spermidine/putrescine transport system ATP-binding protein